MKIDEIKIGVEKNDIISRTKKGFVKWLGKYKEEEPGEYSQIMKDIIIKKLLFELHTISLNISN